MISFADSVLPFKLFKSKANVYDTSSGFTTYNDALIFFVSDYVLEHSISNSIDMRWKFVCSLSR